MSIEMQKVLEFHDLFPDENSYDVIQVLKKYNRDTIVKLVNVLGYSYGNAYIPNDEKRFFSINSHEHVNELRPKIDSVLKKIGAKEICFCTIRTILELLRIAFSIPSEDYYNSENVNDIEYDLFRVLLKLNEKLMDFNNNSELKLDELTFFNLFCTNDTNNFDISDIFKTQVFYSKSLFYFLINKKPELYKALIDKWRINDYKEYIRSIVSLFILHYDKQCVHHMDGNPILDLDTHKLECLSERMVNNLAIDIIQLIPYSSEDTKQRDNNIDYKVFRSKPLIHISEKKYYLYNLQLLCERLYNSLFFDLKSVYKEGDFFNFYNKEFVEYYLFRNSIQLCISNTLIDFTYPTKEMIGDNGNREDINQPDFYIRQGNSIVLFECKAFKINGDLKDKADIDEFLKILKNKIFSSCYNIDKSRTLKKKPELVGVTQLFKEMELIDDNRFDWDNKIPDSIECFPVIVLEDPKLVQPGLMSMINRWAESLEMNQFQHISYYPIIVMSIDTLFLYSDYFNKEGFPKIFRDFITMINNNKTPDPIFNNLIIADFNYYMHHTFQISRSKQNYYNDLGKLWIN